MIKFEPEYLIQDDNGLTKGDKVIHKGEEFIFVDKFITEKGYHRYNFFKECEVVKSTVLQFHDSIFTSHPKEGVIKVLEKGCYKVSDREWMINVFENMKRHFVIVSKKEDNQ